MATVVASTVLPAVAAGTDARLPASIASRTATTAGISPALLASPTAAVDPLPFETRPAVSVPLLT